MYVYNFYVQLDPFFGDLMQNIKCRWLTVIHDFSHSLYPLPILPEMCHRCIQLRIHLFIICVPRMCALLCTVSRCVVRLNWFNHLHMIVVKIYIIYICTHISHSVRSKGNLMQCINPHKATEISLNILKKKRIYIKKALAHIRTKQIGIILY